MRLPAVWLLAAFSCGAIAAGTTGGRVIATGLWLAGALMALSAGFILYRREQLRAAWVASLLAWAFVGGLATAGEKAAVPLHHVTRLVAQGNLNTEEALRWRGQLSRDPSRQPWGFRYEISLSEADSAGRAMQVAGGLRVNYFVDAGRAEELPSLRAGDFVEVLVRARPPRAYQNPGSFDARAHFARRGIHLTGTLRSAELIRKLDGPALTPAHRFARWHGQLLILLDSVFSPSSEESAILRAMLLGDAGFIDHEVSEAFQKTAVYHVLVISGLHVTALAVLLWWVGRRARLPLWFLSFALLLLVIAFVAIVEDRPPVERAAWMTAVAVCARLLFRQVNLLNAVAIAALMLLVARPSSLTDPSFQLTFLAAAAIAGIGLPWIAQTSQPLRRALNHLSDVSRDAAHAPRAAQFRLDLRTVSGWIAGLLPARLAARSAGLATAPVRLAIAVWDIALVSLSIQLSLVPVMAVYFHRVSLIGIAANLPAAVLSSAIIPMGFLTLLASAVWQGLAKFLAAVTVLLVRGLASSAAYFSELQWAAYRVPDPPVWLHSSFYALLAGFALACVAGRKRRQLALGVPLAAMAVLCAVHPFAPDVRTGSMELTVLDVGQGDSIFAAFPDGRTMLIDGGGVPGPRRVRGVRAAFDVGEQVVSPYLWRRRLKRLDVAVLTHAHQDHLDGLQAVLENFAVGELWVGREVNRDSFRTLLQLARQRGTRIEFRNRGQQFSFAGVQGTILWPEATEDAADAANNDSLVLKLEHDGRVFLLPGDVEKKIELELLSRGDDLRADVLKVSHHGSRTSSSAEWLAAVAPRVAVMSLGEANPFNHPHRELLERLARPNLALKRTDRDGAVTILSDQRGLQILTYAGLPD